MYHFFVGKENISDREIIITGDDYNHAVNVLRLKPGERIIISDPDGVDYICRVMAEHEDVIESAGKDAADALPPSIAINSQFAEGNDIISFGTAAKQDKKDKGKLKTGLAGNDKTNGILRLMIEEIAEDNHELPAEIVLFQCLPKADKMELIIQKAAELGVTRIVPVASKNCVVKLDDKKASSKIKRWQAIAESAAKQSKRSIIPEVSDIMTFKQAVDELSAMDVRLIPYEDEKGIESMCSSIISFIPGRSIGVMIGSEGGFDPLEVSMAKRHGILPVSLGKRILRTETAAIAILSLIMIRLEIAAGMDLEQEI